MIRKALGILLFVISLSSCTDSRLQTYTANVPVYLPYGELRSSFQVNSGREMVKPGKIYFKDQIMYINEYQQGIHVVDLSDPTHPANIAFIDVPGNVDMAIRDQVMFADSYVDLVMIDISNPLQPSLIKRVENLFEYVIPPYDSNYPLDEIDQEKGVVTRYDLREITREVYQHHYPWPIYYDYAFESDFRSGSPSSGNGNTYGVGGSMARFLTYDSYLYALENNYKLKTIDISNTDLPQVKNEQYLWGNIETLFISGTYMYVGSSNGLHILSLDEPSLPVVLSTYQHVTACDPVVVSGNRAYVTLRAGNWCGGTQNRLEVIDIANKYEPKLMASYAMTEPYGLGIDANTLFVCEGTFGLKVYDANDPYDILSNKIAGFTSIHAYDVIPLSAFLFLIGEDGFYIYDYTDLENISLLGSIPVTPAED